MNLSKTLYEYYSNNGLKFDQLKPVAKDIAVDLVFRGDYSFDEFDEDKTSRSETIQEAIDNSKANLTKLTDLMLDRGFWNEAGVDDHRFNTRADYIYNACKKDKNCNSAK